MKRLTKSLPSSKRRLEERVNNFLTKRFLVDRLPGDECLKEAKQIHGFYHEAGYVKLAKNQSLPENPNPATLRHDDPRWMEGWLRKAYKQG